MSSQSNAPLKTILLLDAATCLLMGLLLATASGFVCSITALPQTLLFCAGILLLPIGLFMAATAIWWPGSAAAVWLIIVGNAGWVIASLGLLMIVTANGLGVVFVLAQALVVAVLAWVEYRALRAGQAALA
ncbi:hypothetical protein GCM10007928_25250 [Sulfitobacter porphyrae]|nr:hypothetical protein GCM10007928_25250 [Sulfitobacter porphyrae]